MFLLILRNIETEGGVTISRTAGGHNTLWPEVEMKSFSLLTNEVVGGGGGQGRSCTWVIWSYAAPIGLTSIAMF